MSNLFNFFHTLRYLRPQQISGQITRRFAKNPRKVLEWTAPPFPGCRWPKTTQFLPPIQLNQSENMQAGRMEFLNQVIDVGWPPNWNRTDLPRLWRYNVQYFDYLWELDFDAAKTVVIDWIDRHTPERGRAGWEPYPTSLRLMNWCATFFGRFAKETDQDTAAVREKLWTSIFRQAQWLSANVETHLMGNHVLENAAALTVVGSCFDGEAPRQWYQRGLDLLREQIAEQFLPDGGHYERSPMYHSRGVYVLLLLKSLGIPEVIELLDLPLTNAIHTLKQLCHPDGEIALFNDSAEQIYNTPAELAEYAGVPQVSPVGAFALPDTGYFGARTSDGAYIICDAGPIGPDYQPGHAHGDMLSLEMSLRGHRVIVDSGVYDYQAGEMRDYCRSTRAHNTVEIDGQDQCEFWDVFRVARRGRVNNVLFAPTNGGFTLSANHDGYTRLKGKPIHARSFRWHDSGGLIITDNISSAANHRAVARLHLHPHCRLLSVSTRDAHIEYSGGEFEVQFQGQGNLSVEDSFYCPQFGQKLPNKSLAWSTSTPKGRSEWTISISEVRSGRS